MFRSLLLSAPFALALAVVTGAAAAQSYGDKMEYAACMKQARSAPRDTLPRAEAWVRAGGGLPAEHCAASALQEMGQYEEAAKRLDALLAKATAFPAAVRADIAAQSGSAWLAIGNAEKALNAQNIAVQLAPGNAENWIDRSITLAGVGAYTEAAEDLSTALKLAPRRADILILRAAAYRGVKDWKRARTDADAALVYDANNPEALIERAYVKLETGDKRGADEDFKRALLFTPPDSATAKEAQAGLARPAGAAPAPAKPVPRKK